MTDQIRIASELLRAFSGQQPLSLDLYVEGIASHESALAASLNDDADDALLCVLVDEGEAAVLLIGWDGTRYRNERGLAHLRAMWKERYHNHLTTLIPVFAEHISEHSLGVAGIRWTATEGGDA